MNGNKNSKRNKNKNKNNTGIARVKGQGGYYTDNVLPVMQKIFPRGTFANFGTGAGGIAANAMAPGSGVAGAAAGRYLGSQISRILGFGDYTVQSNSLSSVGKAIMPGEAVPDFGIRGNETRVRHREYLHDIVVPASPTAFTNSSYTINAGDSYTFPWLAEVAARYQQYKFNGLIFEFKTLSSDITSGGALGAVVLATNYDVLDSAFEDKIHMENSQYAVSAKPSCSQIHTIECAPNETAQKMLYVRSPGSSTTTSQDARFFDLGKFQLATTGLPGSAGQVLGELWVSYDVSLYKPEIPNTEVLSAKVLSAGSVDKSSALFGTSPALTGNAFTLDNTVLTFPRTGQFLLQCDFAGTGVATPTFTPSAGATVLSGTNNSSTDNTFASFARPVKITIPNSTLTIDATGSTSLSGTQARCSEYTYALA